MKNLLLTLIVILSHLSIYAQSSAYIDFTPYPLNLNNPGVELPYTAGIYKPILMVVDKSHGPLPTEEYGTVILIHMWVV